jgi:hypothetical protein
VGSNLIYRTSLSAPTVNSIVYERYNDGGMSFRHETVAVKPVKGRVLTDLYKNIMRFIGFETDNGDLSFRIFLFSSNPTNAILQDHFIFLGTILTTFY